MKISSGYWCTPPIELIEWVRSKGVVINDIMAKMPSAGFWSYKVICDAAGSPDKVKALCAGVSTNTHEKVLVLISDDPSIRYYVICETCAGIHGNVFCDHDLEGLKIKEVPIVPKLKPKCKGCDKPICNVCNICHTEGCVFVEKNVSTDATLAKFKNYTCKTQKALGVAVLEQAKITIPQPWAVVQKEGDIAAAYERVSSKVKDLFVRPCPTRPRHGFVESRAIDSSRPLEDLRETLIAARAADENGYAELMIMPRIEAWANVIITPTRVTIGPGHDGATSGHESMTIPLTGTRLYEITDEVMRKAKIGSEEDPYLEVVIPLYAPAVYGPIFTQLRAGARLDRSIGDDYIPAIMRVDRVLMASGDLLEWEKQVKEIVEGTVVCHVGGSLISHYGVHCLTQKIPIMTSRVPIVGEVLEPLGVREDYDLDALIRGLGVGAAFEIKPDAIDKYKKGPLSPSLALKMTFMALHNAGAMTGEHAFWLGVAVAFMMRCGMAASHGEARHKLGIKIPRTVVYDSAFDDFFLSRDTLGVALWKFKNLQWSSSYGGKKWAECTEALVDLDNHVRALLKEPSQAAAMNLITSLNIVVNKAHNGGWWMDKFVSKSVFDLAAVQSIKQIPEAVGVMYTLKQRMDLSAAQTVIDYWRVADEVKPNHGKLVVEYRPEYELAGEANEDDDDDKDDDTSIGPDLALDITKVKPTTNIGNLGVSVGPEDIITDAQCMIINGHTIHFQFRCAAKSPGYFSHTIAVPEKFWGELKEVCEGIPFRPSFSGSGNDQYLTLLPVYKDISQWHLIIQGIDAKLGTFIFNPSVWHLWNEYADSLKPVPSEMPIGKYAALAAEMLEKQKVQKVYNLEQAIKVMNDSLDSNLFNTFMGLKDENEKEEEEVKDDIPF